SALLRFTGQAQRQGLWEQLVRGVPEVPRDVQPLFLGPVCGGASHVAAPRAEVISVIMHGRCLLIPVRRKRRWQAPPRCLPLGGHSAPPTGRRARTGRTWGGTAAGCTTELRFHARPQGP